MTRPVSTALLAALAALSWCAVRASAAPAITFISKTSDATNFGDSGLNLGNAGYWFAQFNAQAPITNAAVNNNDRNALPAWILPDFNSASANYSFSSTAYSRGGESSWNTLTLPNNETGLSGSLVDPSATNNSNNTIGKLLLGPGVPSSFLFRVVVDNAAGQILDANRIRARAQNPAGTVDLSNQQSPGAGGFNGTADVYTWRYDDWSAGDWIKLQLNSGTAGIPGGFAGVMFDYVPEPSSALLAGLCSVALSAAARSFQRQR